MYEQLSFLNELNIKQDKEEHRKTIYASPCGGCLCGTCANNVDCSHSIPSKEMNEPCFNCDDCYYYNGNGKRNKSYNCDMYKVTEHQVNKIRGGFKVVKN